MGSKLEDFVFNKKPTTKKSVIIKSLVSIAIITVVLVVVVITILSQLGSAISTEEFNEVKSLLQKEYNKSNVVSFEIGAIDENNLKTKLESNFVSFGSLYDENNKLNTNVLFGSARVKESVEFDKKDLTILANACLTHELELDDFENVFSFLNVANLEVQTNNNLTNIRLCIKVFAQKLLKSGAYDFGLISNNDLVDEVYVTCLFTVDNTKPLRNCVTSSSLVVNNLSTEDNTKVLEYFAKFYDKDADITEIQKIPANYFMETLSKIMENWNAGGSFKTSSIEFYAK